MAKNKLDLTELEQAFQKARKTLPVRLGNRSVVFFKANFRHQGFVDSNIKKWTARKYKPLTNAHNPSKADKILIRKNRLRNQIKRLKTTFGEIRVGVKGLQYAAIQNEGGTTHPRVTDKMRGFMRRRANKLKGRKGFKKEASVAAAIANTTKSELTVNIPPRPFIGNSKKHERMMERIINQELKKFITGK